MGNIIKSRAWLLTVACGTAVILSASPALAAPQDAAPESAVETQVQETETPQADQTQEAPETQEVLAGYTIVECASFDRATEIAAEFANCPAPEHVRAAAVADVRPIDEYAADDA